MISSRLSRAISPHAFYGLLGLPLAMAALPVYVQIPAYYTTQLGLPLASTGLVLFFARIVDTVQDPLLGRMIDQRQQRIGGWMLIGALLLAMAFYGLWLPPFENVLGGSSPVWLLSWLGVMLVLAYTAHSMINIAYLAWGARLGVSADSAGTASVSSQSSLLAAAGWREGFGLFGVILASLIPSFILLGTPQQVQGRLLVYVLAFAALLALGIACLLMGAPKWRQSGQEKALSLREALSNNRFRRLLPVYFLNSLSVSIPATLALFFINDRIAAPHMTGYFLATYFVAGAVGLPAWLSIARRIGTVAAWKSGMLLAIVSFVGAAFLGRGDVTVYFLVCVASGLALGADLALPPVLLAEIIPKDEAPASYYGVWTLLGKLALALSGLALPLLSLLAYQPSLAGQVGLSGESSQTIGLVLIYAALPCLLKLCAMRKLHTFNLRGHL